MKTPITFALDAKAEGIEQDLANALARTEGAESVR